LNSSRVARYLTLCVVLMIGMVTGTVSATEYRLTAGNDLVGSLGRIATVYEDTLIDIARAHKLGYEEIRLANPGVDAWLPGNGTDVRLPTRFILPDTKRNGIVINIAEYRMYYFFEAGGDQWVRTFPISIGRMDWGTPLGYAAIVKKVENPGWYPPQSIRDEWAADGRQLDTYVPPGPDNPLGAYALRLSIPGYLIHGTNRPAGVGMRVTHGCIRMFPEDIEWLYPQVPVDTPVRIINQPFKLGWQENDLFLEAHPPLGEGVASEEDADGEIVMQDPESDSGESHAWSITNITERYIKITRERPALIDWELVSSVYEERLGIPVKIGTADARIPSDAKSVQADERPLSK
jgi:L,D-transpeptidase ErfK/SrfK